MHYQNLIHQIDPTVNPAGVEACMRLEYGTLDHLPRETFVDEIQTSMEAEAEQPGFLRSVAESYGIIDNYDNWEPTVQAKREQQAMTSITHAPEPAAPDGFTGETITPDLRLQPSEHHPGKWEIHGQQDHMPALAAPKDLIMLACTILLHFRDSPRKSKLAHKILMQFQEAPPDPNSPGRAKN